MEKIKKTEKGLSARQLTMMALGTVIGGSFFLGSGAAVNAAGPGIMIAYALGGIMVYFTLLALSEMTVAQPDAGTFRAYASKAFGQGTGFVVGWVYFTGMALAMSSEAAAVSILVQKWYPNIPVSLFGASVIVVVTLFNLLGAQKLSRLESGLAAIKLLAIVTFIILAVLLVIGLYPGKTAVGLGALKTEKLLPGGSGGVAGSLLLVMFAYAGFEIIGLAASEAKEPKKTIPKAIRTTAVSLTVLYILSALAILPLIPTSFLSENKSPMVAALDRSGVAWAGEVMNAVLITAILSTMLTAMFGLGRMIRSLNAEGLAPGFLKDSRDVPVRGILFSGATILLGFGISLLFPKVYLFLTSSGGFSVLFTYAVIMATHIRFRKEHGKPNHACRLCGFPFSSLYVFAFLLLSIVCMPLVPGQTSGLIAGLGLVAFYTTTYGILWAYRKGRTKSAVRARLRPQTALEISEEIVSDPENEQRP